MASQIQQMAEDYISNNVAAYDEQPEAQAVDSLAADCRNYLYEQDWNAEDYGVDLRQIAREVLIQHRND